MSDPDMRHFIQLLILRYGSFIESGVYKASFSRIRTDILEEFSAVYFFGVEIYEV
jgi:hypothetical protein